MPFTTALAKAIQTGDINIVASLITEEKSWDVPNQEGLKPIHVAIDYGHLDLVDWLLKKGVSLECATNDDGSTPLHRAASKGQTKIVQHLLQVYKDNPNKRLADDTTPLYFAAAGGYIEIVNLLLEHKANICQANNNGKSPLYIAAQKGHKDIVALLLTHGADINQVNKNGASPLWIAARSGHKAVVSLLLEQRATVDKATNEGESPLFIAVQQGHRDIVVLLLDGGADINQANQDHASPLYVAARQGHIEVVTLLLERGAVINQVNKNGASALYVAAREGHSDIVDLLLKRGAATNQVSKSGASPLWIATRKGHKEVVALLLERRADLSQVDKNAATPLWVAALKGHKEIVTLLLDSGANINQANNNLTSPLFVAAQSGSLETVALLLARGADVDQVSKNGASPLCAAVQQGHKDIVALLLERHANVNMTTNHGESFLYIAAQQGRKDIVALLLTRGANSCQAKNNGKSPLYIAAQKGYKDIVTLLLEHSADIHQVNNKGESSLYIAAREGHKDIVALLLERRANIHQVDNDGASPLYIAAQQGHKDIVASLLEREANVTQVNNNGETPLHAAAREGHLEIVDLLLKHGANSAQVDNRDVTPLWAAAYQGHYQVVEKIITKEKEKLDRDEERITGGEKKFDVVEKNSKVVTLTMPDYQGDTPLHIAVKHGHISVVKILLLYNASVTSLNTLQETPLMLAAAADDVVIFSWLLAGWFQQQHRLKSPEQKQEREEKKPQVLIFSSLAVNDYEIQKNIDSVLPQNFSSWPLLTPAALTLAKATRQSLCLEINQDECKSEAKLGEGAFGEVFRAVLSIGPVALKRMKLESVAEWLEVNHENANNILQWEISQLEKVHHPHVVELLGVVHSNALLLAMELCDTSLDKDLPKTPYAQWQVAWEVACGLAYLHGLGLVHRDIKPENILLKEGIAKIADMGIAQIDPLLLDRAEPDELKRLMGDSKWPVPERVITAATDIYRYGLVLNTFRQPVLRSIVAACLQQDPGHRPSALQVLGTLERNIPHQHPVLAKLCQRLGILAHYHEHELAHFLTPWVSSQPDIDWLVYQEGIEVKGGNAPQLFTMLWQDFLSNHEKRCLDLRGAGGSGKTLLGYYQLKEQWQALRQWLLNPQGNPPTLVLLLTPDYLQTTAFTLEERLAEIYQLTPEECQILKQYPVVFLLDGEDEWQARPQLDLSNWPYAKTWIVGRSSATANDSVYLLPFNQVQIVNYLHNVLTWDEATAREFITQLPLSEIKEVLRNPFVLSMFRLLWPIPNWQELTREAIYYRYFTQFIDRQQEYWLKGPYHKIYEELIKNLQQEHKTLAESYLSYAGEVSLQLFEERRLEGKVEVKSPWGTINKQVAVLAEKEYQEKQHSLAESKEKTHLTLSQYQTFALAHGQRIILPPPLQENPYRFMHKSLFEYAWAYTAQLPNRPLEEDENLLIAYGRQHQNEKPDFTLIDASKQNPRLAAKAGNLLTLYNWARLPLTHDYRGAHIENANLAYANLIGADLRKAKWTNCHFENACLFAAKFDQFSDSNIAPRPHPSLLSHNNTILLSAISSNGKYLATLDQHKVFIWRNQQRVRILSIKIPRPAALAINNKGALIIGDKNGVVYFYSIKTGLMKHINAFHDQPVLNVAFISHQHCWVGSQYSNAIYDCKTHQRTKQWQNKWVGTCTAIQPEFLQQAVGDKRGLTTIDITGTPVKEISSCTFYQAGITALGFSAEGKLATASEDRCISVFGKNSHYSRNFYSTQPIVSLHWSQDSQLLVAITSQGFKVWDLYGKVQGNYKAAAVQAIYMKNSHEGILVEQSGNLYGIALDNEELRITWVVAGEHFQGGIAIQPINEDPVKAEFVKEQEEKMIQQDSKPNTQAIANPVLQHQGLFADKNKDQQAVTVSNDSSQKASAFVQSKEFKHDG